MREGREGPTDSPVGPSTGKTPGWDLPHVPASWTPEPQFLPLPAAQLIVRRPFGPNCCPLVLLVPGSSILGREGSQVPGQVLSCVSWEPRAQGLPLTAHSMLYSDRAAGGPEKPATLSSELRRQIPGGALETRTFLS